MSTASSQAAATASATARPTRRLEWAILLALYVGFGAAGIVFLGPSTAPGADLATYQRAAADWLTTGDPYRSAPFHEQDFQYRYPPLLAMLMPLLGWPPIWFALMGIATGVPIWLAYRDAGFRGFLLPILLAGPWTQQLLNGNVQPAVVALLALVPRFRRAGAIGLAVATMLKLHPALAVVWYLGRRDWQALRWYAATLGVLALIQAPWLGSFVEYCLADPAATAVDSGMSLRSLGIVPWIAGVAVLVVVAYRAADTRYGWMLTVVLQLAVLPRVLLVNLALLLAAPLRGPARRHTGM